MTECGHKKENKEQVERKKKQQLQIEYFLFVFIDSMKGKIAASSVVNCEMNTKIFKTAVNKSKLIPKCKQFVYTDF